MLSEGKQFLMDMGSRISKRRKELQMTQEQLAEAMNLSLQSISCIELGKKGIRPENLLRLCRCLDISADYILKGERSPKQLEGIFLKLSEMADDDYAMAEALIDHLTKRKKKS